MAQARFFLGGGIGSGKTAAGEAFAALGATVVSSDDLARAVLAPGSMQTAAVLERWPEVGDGSGAIERGRLGRLVFADPESLAALEAITHPEITRLLTAAVDATPQAVVMVEMPVLRDLPGRGWPWVVVDAPDDLRAERAAGRGMMTPSEIRRVMERQATRGEWLAVAAWVIDNSGDEVGLAEQCRRVWEEIRP